ncbi:MAG: thioredoxin family protein [Mesorhizobium sp.]|nr:thioredoxin family protein [Mesorhizobium sp.]
MAATADLCEFGWPAVDAHLPGTDGRRHQLFEQAGPGGLVIAFICNHCPYVKSSIGRIVRDARDLRPMGIGFVAINSNDATTHPDDSFENMQLFARANGIDFPYLHDEAQNVARAYGAVCTPDFFGFNADLKLQYRGRLDAARAGPAPEGMTRDLYDAMVKIARSGEGPREQQPSMGCSIKWKNESW